MSAQSCVMYTPEKKKNIKIPFLLLIIYNLFSSLPPCSLFFIPDSRRRRHFPQLPWAPVDVRIGDRTQQPPRTARRPPSVKMVNAKIAPSMLSSDFANLASEAERMVRCGADWLHMDIMDGYVIIRYEAWKILEIHFVPNLTIGAPVIESLRKHTDAYLDCHLMVTNPIDYVEPLGKAGASGFTFHVEASKDNWRELVQQIKSNGMKPGVSLKPGTPIEEVYPLIEDKNPVEMVLVMTVEPGFRGQKFMPEMMDKVRTLRKKYPSLDIEVDGGLGPSTIDMAADAGANCIVAGNSVFGAPDPSHVISLMRKSVDDAQMKQFISKCASDTQVY
ncbi:ribulose-phosphate 3-epimerase [Striga asiatica]|uniref:ribulose-phosphate 3-epimerase n=1 Tax=Striga asiatica TaxID=4170 RepID=A0A5A7QS92_STRAF|nr:ribulose-phosphate 3-epimerase [Striga asiatica]